MGFLILIAVAIIVVPAYLIELAANKYLEVKKELIDYENRAKSREVDN